MRVCVQVVIPSGKHVLLDVQPATLATLTIEANASLVWGNVPKLELRSELILVDGAFHMGSPTCRFEKRASIRLIGNVEGLVHRMDMVVRTRQSQITRFIVFELLLFFSFLFLCAYSQ